MATSNASASTSNILAGKRRKLSDRASNIQEPSQSQLNEKDVYDPDQDVEERRRVRKGLRDLTRELHGMGLSYVPFPLNSDKNNLLMLVCRLAE